MVMHAMLTPLKGTLRFLLVMGCAFYLQRQQQQQEQEQHRKSCSGGLAALFDGHKRRASEAGTGRPAKKFFFQKAE